MHHKTAEQALMALTANLVHVSQTKPTLHMRISRTHGRICTIQRYNRTGAGSTVYRKLIDGLVELNLIERHIGYYDRYRKRGHQTRIRLTDDMRLTLARELGEQHQVGAREDAETIILRDENKRPIDYEDNSETTAMRGSLSAYNALLQASEIDLERSDEKDRWFDLHRIDKFRKRYVRIFNRGEFDLGGRYYGPWWVSCPSWIRQHIRINGEHVSELDYSAMNVELAYSRIGLKSRDVLGDEDDIYDVPGFEQIDRDIRKRAMLMLLAANSRKQAVSAINKHALRFYIHLGKGTAENLIDALVKRHEAISELHFQDLSLPLQRTESMVSEEVIRQSVEAGIPVLNIHDGFVVPVEKEFEVRGFMEGAFQALELESIPKIK